jgi:hypothetical protein
MYQKAFANERRQNEGCAELGVERKDNTQINFKRYIEILVLDAKRYNSSFITFQYLIVVSFFANRRKIDFMVTVKP